jgi:hypothetical protein
MSKGGERVRLRLNERLRESERRPSSMALPIAIQHRLDWMAEMGKDIDATRAEIIGMLLAGAKFEAEELELAILRYRKLKVADVLPEDEVDRNANVVSISRRGPGRPAKSGNS